MDLTIEQTELLWQATEIFHQWYKKYYEDPPPFSDLLSINHVKILDMFEGIEYTEDELNQTLIGLIGTYQKLLEDY